MDISAWDVYWIMRLDGIKEGLTALFPIGLFLLFISGFLTVACWVNDDKNELPIKKAVKCYIAIASIWAFFMLSNLFIPTTREAATIFVLPRVANSKMVMEEIPKEAREIYGLAKQWFEKSVKEKGK